MHCRLTVTCRHYLDKFLPNARQSRSIKLLLQAKINLLYCVWIGFNFPIIDSNSMLNAQVTNSSHFFQSFTVIFVWWQELVC